MMKNATKLLLAVLLVMGLFGCGGKRPADIGVTDDRLSPCPASPNCVASDAVDADHRIEPFSFEGDPAGIWGALKTIVADLPRTTIITADDRYLHAEAKSRLFGFVDDVEFHLRPADSLIAVRSASRVGYSDMGVNAERIATIRQTLRAKGFVP